MKGIIISGGTPPSKELFLKEMENTNIIICADGGANFLYDIGVKPDILIGDFDSINKKCLQYFKENSDHKLIKYPREKDYTDSELAVNEALKVKVDELTLLGFTGSRIDHMLGNIGLLLKCLNNNIKAVIKDDNNEIQLINKSSNFYGTKGKLFSLYSYGNLVDGLTIKGGKYPLNNYNLKLGEPIGISNEFKEEKIEISFKKGLLLVMFCGD